MSEGVQALHVNGGEIFIPFIKNNQIYLPIGHEKIEKFAARSARGNFYIYENSSSSEYLAYWEHLHETVLRERFWAVKPGEIVVDCGANFGSYTLSALADGAGMVYAFEPSPVSESLENCIKLNHFEQRAHVFKKKANSLDKMKLGRVNRIKIDVEGDELQVLKGARKLIQEYKPMLIIECHLSKNQNIITDVMEAAKPFARLTNIQEGLNQGETIHLVIDF